MTSPLTDAEVAAAVAGLSPSTIASIRSGRLMTLGDRFNIGLNAPELLDKNCEHYSEFGLAVRAALLKDADQ